MKRFTRAWLFAVALAAAGCATTGGYQPTVDPYNDPYVGRIPQDEADCRELALHASGGTPTKSAIGAATGGVGGGTFEGLTAEQRLKTAFQTCMRDRGHRVLD